MIKSVLLGVIVLSLIGCKTIVPKVPEFPEAPAELTEECGDLTPHTEDDGKLTSTLTTVVENYSKYYQCSIKQRGWIEWYNSQKEINNAVKE